MGYSLRYFIAEDEVTLTRVPAARYLRWLHEGERLAPNRAGRELALLEVALEVDRHHVVEVLRILPVRHHVRRDGRLDASIATQLALKRLDILERVRGGDAGAQIEQLEADANYFWLPTDAQLRALGAALLKSQPSPAQLQELRAAVFRPGDALRDE